ncbi:ribosomal protein L30 family protein [Wolffia australiana]
MITGDLSPVPSTSTINPSTEIQSRRSTQGKRSAKSITPQTMSAFNAFKACVPIEWSPRLYITLVRGLPGTRRLHRRTLEAMRLRRCNRTVSHRNTPSLLGMLTQVKRLIVVETEVMYNARKEKIEAQKALRPPIVVTHNPPAASVVAEAAAESECQV